MKRTSLSVIVVLASIIFSTQAMAHTLWINLYESHTHQPGHAMVSLGFGHAVPMDDFLGPETGVMLSTYELIDTDMGTTVLPLPDMTMPEKFSAGSDMTFQSGDLGNLKLCLTENTKPGTYQVAVTSKDDTFFSLYLDKKGKQKWIDKPMDAIKGAEKILTSIKSKNFAKAYFSVNEWTDPKPLGHELEIMPMTDLSNVHVGDVVPFQISLMGKPFSMGADTIEYITAFSNSFGGPDNFFLAAYIMNGKAQFRMPAAGQWVVNVYVKQDVTPENAFKDLVGKCTMVLYAATVSFNVKP